MYRLTLLNFDLNGAAELPTGRGPTGKRGRPAGKRGPSGGRARPVGVVRRWIKALPAGRRQHGPAAGRIRGALLAWSNGGLRGCRRGGANMGWRRAGVGAPCWRDPTVDQGFAGGAAPTWAGAGRDLRRPVGVARRWGKGLPAGRRQHGPAAGVIKGESDVDALVFPPHASTPLSELMHEYPFFHPMHHF